MKTFISPLLLGVLLLIASYGANAQLRINEFLASNDASFPGPQGDYPDWIEVYNAGSTAVDMGGYWICDDLNEPDKLYQIPTTSPSTTTVQPGGFILFIANGDPTGGVLNLNFKLSGSGEHIGIWLPDKTTVVDTMSYDAQTTDVSMGLSPNGGTLWYFFTNPTPGASNPDYTGVSEKTNSQELSCMPNPCKDQTTINFTLPTTSNIQLSVFDLMGKQVALVANTDFASGTHSISLNTEQLKSGLYFYRLKTPVGTITRKLQVTK